MRRYTKALLLMLVALLYAGTAGAYSISILPQAENFAASDTLTVDVWVDTDGNQTYGWTFWVLQDPAYLSPDGTSSTLNPTPNQDEGSLYLYPSGAGWYITQTMFLGEPSVNQSIATLVFHVVQDLPSSYVAMVPTFSYAGYNGDFSGPGGSRVTGLVVLNALHVPEPTTTMLMGLGLLGILYAGRRR